MGIPKKIAKVFLPFLLMLMLAVSASAAEVSFLTWRPTHRGLRAFSMLQIMVSRLEPATTAFPLTDSLPAGSGLS